MSNNDAGVAGRSLTAKADEVGPEAGVAGRSLTAEADEVGPEAGVAGRSLTAKADEVGRSGSGTESVPSGNAARGRIVLDAASITRAAKRMAHEIAERNGSVDDVVLVAIVSGGVPVAELVHAQLREITGVDVPLGALDVTLYRDDVIGRGRRPIPHPTRMPASVGGKRVVLVDDVIFTGRTIRAAMDAVIDFGRPEAIQVATLVDRGHRELPIRVDYVGKNIPTARADKVVLRRGDGGELEVVV